MSLKPLCRLLLVACCLPFGTLMAQKSEPYSYQELSHVFYNKQKDSLKKNWKCPALFKEKETQKKYQEIWDSRTGFITEALESKSYVHDKELFDYITNIIEQITRSNSTLIPVKPMLLIDRSSSVNAYTIGGNIIAVNAGLIAYARDREEIALVIAHELSHSILQHADNSMKERAAWLTSQEYKNSLNAVLDSKYERLTRLKKILEVYSYSRSRHNRYHESEADSLAIVLLKNSHIDYNPTYFLRLDSADIQYKQPLSKPLKSYFTAYNIPFEDAWTQKRSKGLSTKAYNFRDTTSINDSLKTHPDCKDRYAKTLSLATGNGAGTRIPEALKETANKIMIWNMFNNMNLTGCMYRILLEKDKGNKDEWYDFMLHNVFTGLYYADKELARFNSIGVMQKEYISKDYYELQNMFEQIPREQLQQCCKQLQSAAFWSNMDLTAKDLKSLMQLVSFEEGTTAKMQETAAKKFFENHPSSMYCEFADNFKKK